MKCRKCHGVTPRRFWVKGCIWCTAWSYDAVRRLAARDDRNLPVPPPAEPKPARRPRKGGVG